MWQRLVLGLYSALAWLAIPLLRRKLRRRAVAEPGYAWAVAERFGHYTQPPATASAPMPARPLVWLHAVSLGETRAAAVLLPQLRTQIPGMRLLLTHGTATGRAEGERLLQEGDLQAWLPWDTPAAVRRFLVQFQPAIGVLMDTEVWPNLVAISRRQQVPLVLANARLNEKSLRGAQRLAWLARPAYGALAAVWAQTQPDAQRLRALGAPVAGVLGNLKFDAQPDARQWAQGRAWRAAGQRPVLLLASSRETEEALWLEIFKKKQAETLMQQAQAAIKNENRMPPVQWLLVPRHPQRFDEVEALCLAAGLSVARRSQWGVQPPQADVWLGDSLGEMALYYGLADAALLGGSFAPLGGQNLIEALACGCPVVLGPHSFNFAEAAEQAVQAGAAKRVADIAEGVTQALAWVRDGPGHQRAVQCCAGFVAQHQGAAQRTAEAIGRLWAQRGAQSGA